MSRSTGSPRAALALVGFLALGLACSLAAPANKLMKEFNNISQSDDYKRGLFEVDLVDEKDFYKWRVRLLDIGTKSELYWDLLKLRKMGREGHIEFEIIMAREGEGDLSPIVRFISPYLNDPSNPNFCQKLKLDDTPESELSLKSLIMAVREYVVKRELRVNFDNL